MSYTFDIQSDITAPCYATEDDIGRGADAFEAVCVRSGMTPERLRDADLSRGNKVTDHEAVKVIERASSEAEEAITVGWADQTADSSVTFWINT